jgi:hypothetical protein
MWKLGLRSRNSQKSNGIFVAVYAVFYYGPSPICHMLFLAFLMLDLKNIVQNVSAVFSYFAQGNREADVKSRSPPKINNKF